VLTISHRLSTLGHVDEIIVLHKGRIVEHGTYNELKAAGGVFSWLLTEQNRYNLDRGDDQRRRFWRPVRRVLRPRAPSANGRNGRRPQPSDDVPRVGTGEGL
jgi:ABC-type multidrug transport system ATPase subunit